MEGQPHIPERTSGLSPWMAVGHRAHAGSWNSAAPAPDEEGGHLLSLCMVGRVGGHVEVEPVEARSRAPVPQQRRVDVVHGRQQPDGGAARQLGQQLLRLGALQACRSMHATFRQKHPSSPKAGGHGRPLRAVTYICSIPEAPTSLSIST